MTEETRQQNDSKLFKKLPLLCEQIGIEALTVSGYLHRSGFFIDKQHRHQHHPMTSLTKSYYIRKQNACFPRIEVVEDQVFKTLLQCGGGDVSDKGQGVLLEWMLGKIEKNGRIDGSSFPCVPECEVRVGTSTVTTVACRRNDDARTDVGASGNESSGEVVIADGEVAVTEGDIEA